MEDYLSRSFTSISLRYNSQDQAGSDFQSNKYSCSPSGHRKERGSYSLDLGEEMGEKKRTAEQYAGPKRRLQAEEVIARELQLPSLHLRMGTGSSHMSRRALFIY